MARRSPTARGLRSAVMSVACLLQRNAAAGFRRSRKISVASAARRECVTEDFGHHNDSRVQTGFGERGGAGERSEHHRVRHHQRQVVVPVEMTGTSTAVVIAPMRAATLAFRFGARTTSGNNRSVFSRKRHFLNRLGLTLVLSPHNPPTQLPHGTRKISRPVTHNPTTTPRRDRQSRDETPAFSHLAREGFGCHPPAIPQHRHPVRHHIHTDDLGAQQIRCRLRSLLDRLDGITAPPEQCRSWRTSHLGGRLDRPRPASVHPVQHPLRTPAPVHPRQHIRTGTAPQLGDLGMGDDRIVMPEHQQRLSAVRKRGGMIRRAGPRGVLGSVGGALDRKNHRHTTHTPTEIRS